MQEKHTWYILYNITNHIVRLSFKRDLVTRWIFLFLKPILVNQPLPLVHKFNGTTAGLDYLEVSCNCNCPCNSSLWAIGYNVRIANPMGGEWPNSSTDFNLNTKLVISASLEASCQTTPSHAHCTMHTHPANPKQNNVLAHNVLAYQHHGIE